MNQRTLVIKGGIVFVEDAWLENRFLVIQDGCISAILSASDEPEVADSDVFNATGLYLIPGLIDTHTYGVEGIDTYTGGLDALLKLRQIFPRYGVTGFLPSVPACSRGEIANVAESCEMAMASTDHGATVLGLFSEGMSAHVQKSGAQRQTNEACTIEEFIEILYRYPNVFRIITLAPELEKSTPIFAACQDLEIIASLGHSIANNEQAAEAFVSGYNHVTHLYNAMGQLVEEGKDGAPSPGPAAGALFDDEVYTEIIADGFHVPPEFVRIALKTKHPDKMVLVSDSMRAAGTSFIGKMSFLGQVVEVTENVALLDTGRPAASILTLDKAIRNVVMWNAASLKGTIRMATKNAARMLSLFDRGQIAIGYRADIAALDSDLNVQATWCQGVQVHGI